jgi:hypothetical protein
MSESFRRYRCVGCNLIFTADLEPDEVHFCVLCGHTKLEKIDEGDLVLCTSCGIAIAAVDAEHCVKCNQPLCNTCAHLFLDAECSNCHISVFNDLHDQALPKSSVM